eukprot:TRINITY_DN19_c0_g1_i8.p1 TRINITY_DN19_c0_g1~~TRINITY_DN19_c0_g1_i8.p1  ORF type:complete len:136 (+),score=80.00 TRINITY_DN19_c0_g1_i8:73-480(+)
MVKFLKPGKVVILLNGRQAGKKAVIINNMDDGSKERPYSHAIVAGIEKYPLKVTKDMNKKKLSRRSRVKPFLKVVNVSHLLPTRYGLDIKVSTRLTSETLKDTTKKQRVSKEVKRLLQERYLAGKNKWFFSKLRF